LIKKQWPDNGVVGGWKVGMRIDPARVAKKIWGKEGGPEDETRRDNQNTKIDVAGGQDLRVAESVLL